MEYVDFKFLVYQKSAIVSEFQHIAKENNISYSQYEIKEVDNDYSILQIPDYFVEKMTAEHIETLNSFK